MTIRYLNSISIEIITDVFNQAFSDYEISISFTEATKTPRLKRSRVQLDYSIGVFDDDRLVAFILSGIGEWHGKKTIYNAGTGVIPTHRGQRLVKKMYEFGIPTWKKAGFTQLALEVLVDNKIAIKAYQSVGLDITHRLVSYHGQTQQQTVPLGVKLLKKEHPSWAKYASISSFDFAWDFCKDGVEAVIATYQTYELVDGDSKLLGFAIVNSNNQIAQASVHSPKDWRLLMNALGTHYDHLKWINIPESQTILIEVLKSMDWKLLVEQFEMRGPI